MDSNKLGDSLVNVVSSLYSQYSKDKKPSSTHHEIVGSDAELIMIVRTKPTTTVEDSTPKTATTSKKASGKKSTKKTPRKGSLGKKVKPKVG